MTTPYPHLFSPLSVGPLTLPHRAIMSAHGMGLGAGGACGTAGVCFSASGGFTDPGWGVTAWGGSGFFER